MNNRDHRRTSVQFAKLINAAHQKIIGNRGGIPKWKAIHRRLDTGKPVSEAERQWLKEFQKQMGLRS
jgi:hypothetical protein